MITGQTLINHSVRVKLRLSLQEYTIVDFFYGWFKTNENKPKAQDYYVCMGIKLAEESFWVNQLVEKGLLTKDFKPTEIWNKEFKDSSATFDALWKLHSKGNKKTARQRFDKVVKKVTVEELESKLKAYIASNEFQYLKGLDVWLNPEKEHWNDPIVQKIELKSDEGKMKGMIL